jgi:AcrR family transcriptional regulator
MVVDDALLAGAHRAIERYGWQQATLERIATEAGVSRMTLHRRGVTREGLLGALAERLEAAYRGGMWPALTASGSGRERLEQALAGYCEAVEANLEVLVALAEADHDAIFHEDGPRGLTRPAFTEPIRRLLQDGVADGSLVADDPDETATLLLNLVSWTYRHLRRGHGWTPQRARDGVLRIALDGVAARPPTALPQGAEPPGGGTSPPSTPSQGSEPPGGGTPWAWA